MSNARTTLSRSKLSTTSLKNRCEIRPQELHGKMEIGGCLGAVGRENEYTEWPCISGEATATQERLMHSVRIFKDPLMDLAPIEGCMAPTSD
jgi:hypothetical protein